jgi:hypothetical protein
MIDQYNPILLIAVKSLGLISMIASSFIIRHILKRLVGKRDRAAGAIESIASKITLTQSIMLCLSCGDFISSFFVPFLSTWMVPKVREKTILYLNNLVIFDRHLHYYFKGYKSIMG